MAKLEEYIPALKYGADLELDAGEIVTVSPSATGTGLDIDADAITSGKALDISNLDAITTGKAIHVDATGTTHTTGILVHLDSAGTAIATTGRILHSDHTGATTTSGVLNEFSSAANDETTIVRVTASDALAAGVALDISAASMTTGTALDIGGLNALTSGIGINVVANSSDTGAFTLGYFKNDHASATGAVVLEAENDSTGNTVVIDHNGATGKALYIDAESTTQTGGVVDIDANTVTTGTVIDVGNADALTSGKVINIVMNSSDTGAYRGIYVKADHASATGAVPLELVQDSTGAALVTTSAATSTNFFKVGTFNSVTLWVGNGNTGNSALSGTAGDILFNGGTNKPEYCTGTTNWTALV